MTKKGSSKYVGLHVIVIASAIILVRITNRAFLSITTKPFIQHSFCMACNDNVLSFKRHCFAYEMKQKPSCWSLLLLFFLVNKNQIPNINMKYNYPATFKNFCLRNILKWQKINVYILSYFMYMMNIMFQ